MTETIEGIIIGGSIAVAGGFVASLFGFIQSWRQRAAEERQSKRELLYRYAHEDWSAAVEIAHK